MIDGRLGSVALRNWEGDNYNDDGDEDDDDDLDDCDCDDNDDGMEGLGSVALRNWDGDIRPWGTLILEKEIDVNDDEDLTFVG